MSELTKNTKISMEILVSLITMSVFIAGSIIRAEMNNASNSREIATLQGQLTEQSRITTQEFKLINSTLNEMLIEKRVENELNAIRMGDRWTAAMMDEYATLIIRKISDLIDFVMSVHPEARMPATPWPNVESIQKKQLQRLYNDSLNH